MVYLNRVTDGCVAKVWGATWDLFLFPAWLPSSRAVAQELGIPTLRCPACLVPICPGGCQVGDHGAVL